MQSTQDREEQRGLGLVIESKSRPNDAVSTAWAWYCCGAGWLFTVGGVGLAIWTLGRGAVILSIIALAVSIIAASLVAVPWTRQLVGRQPACIRIDLERRTLTAENMLLHRGLHVPRRITQREWPFESILTLWVQSGSTKWLRITTVDGHLYLNETWSDFELLRAVLAELAPTPPSTRPGFTFFMNAVMILIAAALCAVAVALGWIP